MKQTAAALSTQRKGPSQVFESLNHMLRTAFNGFEKSLGERVFPTQRSVKYLIAFCIFDSSGYKVLYKET